jgi:succinate dehydrogenase/fumarate reductase flavoprotein subunit
MGPICWATCGYSLVREGYKWSLDNSEEIEKGWIVEAKTISELAKLISMDESNLAETVATYNDHCKNGKDADFGRSKECLKAIEGPPYYSARLFPSLVNTQGGPRKDKEAKVLDLDGNPISRLYAVGEFGSIWGFQYQTSTNYSECLVFGRIAGKNAALSSPADL